MAESSDAGSGGASANSSSSTIASSEASSSFADSGEQSLFLGNDRIREFPSPMKAIDLGAFLEKFKLPEYELKPKERIEYDRFPVKYSLPSYGREAIGLYLSNTKTNLKHYRPLSLYRTSAVYNKGISKFPKISYKQAEKYSMN